MQIDRAGMCEDLLAMAARASMEIQVFPWSPMGMFRSGLFRLQALQRERLAFRDECLDAAKNMRPSAENEERSCS